MFELTEAAKNELQKRLQEDNTKQLIRLQLRQSCWVKMKLTIEESIKPDDAEYNIDGLQFIIDKNELHYFTNKKIDYLPDTTGFMQFEAI